MRRRSFLTAAGAAAAAGLALKSARDHDEAAFRANVFVARAASYTEDLEQILRNGLQELGLGPAIFKGKTVLLKPNLVEPTRTDPQINTHPAVVRAAGEVFRRWQAIMTCQCLSVSLPIFISLALYKAYLLSHAWGLIRNPRRLTS